MMHVMVHPHTCPTLGHGLTPSMLPPLQPAHLKYVTNLAPNAVQNWARNNKACGPDATVAVYSGWDVTKPGAAAVYGCNTSNGAKAINICNCKPGAQ